MIVCILTLHNMKKEGTFHMLFEKDNPKLPRKRKASSHYEEREAPVELVFKVEEH